MKTLFAIFLLGISGIATSSTDDVVRLLNSGKGIDAVRILEERVAASEGDAKLTASYQLADVCMLLDDEHCLSKIYSSSWKEMNENLKRFDPKNKNQRPVQDFN